MQRLGVVAAVAFACAAVGAQEPGSPRASADDAGVSTRGTRVPRTWDDAAMRTLELPNAVTGQPAQHVSAATYYATPVRTIYRTYPVYASGREPEGYLDWLRGRDPEVLFDTGDPGSQADWLAAGELVFRWPVRIAPYVPGHPLFLRQPMARYGGRTTPDGIDPFTVFVVRERGNLEIGTMSCATCHSRVMDDGTVVLGAQGNSPFDHAFAATIRVTPPEIMRDVWTLLYSMPSAAGVAPPYPPALTTAAMSAATEAIPPGVLSRQGASPFTPVQIPDLIGIRDRRYLDRSGLVRHRSIGDLMRYVALNQGFDLLSSWSGYSPAIEAKDPLPVEARERYSDAQLYALANFLYSLEPPANPAPPDPDLVERGRAVFEEESCGRCHEPPLYTSNQLVPAPGFEVPDGLRATDRIRRRGVGTDPTQTLTTRRGTGFYKVPSLLGVWYRGPFTHDGSLAMLEDWFDPARVRDDYVPTGWNPGGGPRAVVGHGFGLDLGADEKAALLAFLRSL